MLAHPLALSSFWHVSRSQFGHDQAPVAGRAGVICFVINPIHTFKFQ